MAVDRAERSQPNPVERNGTNFRATAVVVLVLLVLAGCSSGGPGSPDSIADDFDQGGSSDQAVEVTEDTTPDTGSSSAEATTADLGFSPGAGLRDQDDARLAGDLDAMVEIGATWIRIDIDWSVIEPEPGRYDWSQTDRIVDAAEGRGLQVLAMVAYSPPWARPDGMGDKAPPNEDRDFADFVSLAVSRYRPKGVRTWQVWNEPNSALFWATGPDPERYGSLLTAAAGAIRAGDADALILSAGLAPADDRPAEGWMSPETFLQALIDNGSLADVDAVGIHPYSFPARPLDPASAPWNTFLRLPDLHRLLQESEIGPKEIWITEYGAPTGTHKRAVTETDQAVLLIDAIEAAAEWPWLGPIFLYTLRDFREQPEDLEWNYGILRSDGSPKQAWIELLQQTG